MQKESWQSLYLGIPKLWETSDIFPNMILSLGNEENNAWEVKVLKQRKEGEIGNIAFGLVFFVVDLFLFSGEI